MFAFGLWLNIFAAFSTSLALFSLTWRSSSAQITSENVLSPWPGTRPVKWTLYTGATMKWNAASQLCRDKGGHLPVLNTFLAIMHFLGLDPNKSHAGVWIGLRRSKNHDNFFAWEQNCSAAFNDSDFWEKGHPDKTKKCTRIPTDRFGANDIKVWSSTNCHDEHGVICEFAAEESSFKTWQNHNFSAEPIATSRNVSNAEQCRSMCEELRVAREECVAALFEPEDTLCKLFKVSQEARPVNVTGTDYNGILMTREVFRYGDEEMSEDTKYENVQDPYSDCKATETCFHDVIPNGVNITGYDPVSTMCGNSCIRGRLFTLNGSVTTSTICGDQEVAIAESEEELAFFIQCLCEDKDLPGFVVHLKTEQGTPITSLQQSYGCISPRKGERDCADHKIVGCKVKCPRNLPLIALKSVLCENKNDINAPTTTCAPTTTTTAPATTPTTIAAPGTTPTTIAAPGTTPTTTAAPVTTPTTNAATAITPTTPAAPGTTPPCRKTTNTTLPCCCKCYKVRNFSKELNLTTEKLLEKRDKEIKKELTVNVSNLSKTTAKKMSQVDQRGSSQSIGSLAIVLFSVVFGMLVLSDFNKLGACPHCLRRNEKEEITLQEEEKMKTEEQKREWGGGDGK